MTDWQMGWLGAWPTDWLTDGLTGWFACIPRWTPAGYSLTQRDNPLAARTPNQFYSRPEMDYLMGEVNLTHWRNVCSHKHIHTHCGAKKNHLSAKHLYLPKWKIALDKIKCIKLPKPLRENWMLWINSEIKTCTQRFLFGEFALSNIQYVSLRRDKPKL